MTVAPYVVLRLIMEAYVDHSTVNSCVHIQKWCDAFGLEPEVAMRHVASFGIYHPDGIARFRKHFKLCEYCGAKMIAKNCPCRSPR